MANKIIKVGCEGTFNINFNELRDFQEDIKDISEVNLKKLKNSIKEKFVAPFFVWKYKDNYWLLDGHQRKKALKELEKEGWEIPELPAIEIFAKSKIEAKKIITKFISQHGDLNRQSVEDYIKKYKINLENIVLRNNEIKIRNVNDFEPVGIEEQGKLDQLDPKMIECPHCGKEFDVRKC